MFDFFRRLRFSLFISWKYRDLFREGKKLRTQINEFELFWDHTDLFSRICVYFHGKSITRFNSIYILCKRGMGKDAAVLLRSMFEDYVHLSYMDRHRDKLQDFVGYDDYLRLSLEGNLEKIGCTSEEIEYRKIELRKKWTKNRQRFLNTKNRVWNTWSGKPLDQMCERGDSKDDYDLLYRYLSKYAHPTSIPVNNYFVKLDEKEVVLSITSEHLLEYVLPYTNIYFHKINKIVDNHFANFKKFN